MLACSPFQRACNEFFPECTGMTLSVALQTRTAHILISRIKLCFKNHLISLDKRDLQGKTGEKACCRNACRNLQ